MTTLRNSDVAAVFHEMSDLLFIMGGDFYRARAFARIGRAVERLAESVETMLSAGTLSRVPGVGDGGVHRIKEILRTGTCEDLTRLCQRMPRTLRDLLKVRGVGPRTLRVLHTHLRIETVEQLEQAARAGQLNGLPRIGALTAQRILQGIAALRQRQDRVPLPKAIGFAEEVLGPLRDHPGVKRVELAGSLRRSKESTKDFDILVATDVGGTIVETFTHLPQVTEVLVGNQGRCSVLLECGLQADLRLLPVQTFGAGLHYFTGSKDHNIAIRVRGHRMGFKIGDYGVFTDTDERLIDPCPTEDRVFAAVGLPWIPPELREGIGEIEIAEQHRLPRLLEPAQVQGDLHMHTTYSDGDATVEQMVIAALERGHRYVAITDHSYMVKDKLEAQRQEIEALRRRFPRIAILHGVEVDILASGELQLPRRVLAGLDWVVASVHNQFELPEAVQTNRLIRAMESGVVDLIGHPTCRRFSSRPPIALDLERVLLAARRTGVALECNGGPDRLDLDATSCRNARVKGIPLCVNSDAHGTGQLANQLWAIRTARRGWAEAAGVLNCYPVDALTYRRQQRMHRLGLVAAPKPLVSPPAAAPRQAARRAPAAATPASAAPARPALDLTERLTGELRQVPLAEALRERLSRFMAQAGDVELEHALARLGGPPMQVAVQLLTGIDPKGGTPPPGEPAEVEVEVEAEEVVEAEEPEVEEEAEVEVADVEVAEVEEAEAEEAEAEEAEVEEAEVEEAGAVGTEDPEALAEDPADDAGAGDSVDLARVPPARLQLFLMGVPDPALEAALSADGAPALQAAMELLAGPATEGESIAVLRLPGRVLAALDAAGLRRVADLAELDDRALGAVRGIGPTSVVAIRRALDEHANR